MYMIMQCFKWSTEALLSMFLYQIVCMSLKHKSFFFFQSQIFECFTVLNIAWFLHGSFKKNECTTGPLWGPPPQGPAEARIWCSSGLCTYPCPSCTSLQTCQQPACRMVFLDSYSTQSYLLLLHRLCGWTLDLVYPLIIPRSACPCYQP